jgi:hypothetical protein
VIGSPSLMWMSEAHFAVASSKRDWSTIESF